MSTVVANTLVVLVVGAAGLAGIIASVYLMAIIFDHCMCCPQGIALEHLRFLQGGAIARQAGLLSLSSKERRQILSKLLNSQPFVPKETPNDGECDPHQSKSDNTSDSQSVQDDSDLEMGTLDHVSESTMDDVDEVKPNIPTKGTEEDEVKETSQLSVENQDSETINEDKDIEAAVLPANETAAEATEEDVTENEPKDETAVEAKEEDLTEKEPKDDAQHKLICAICIADYEEGEMVATGTTCSHLFHTECLLDWLDKHDACPYCRKDMMTAEEMKSAAEIVLSKGRLAEVARGVPSEEDLAVLAAEVRQTNNATQTGERAEMTEGTA
eukprot:CAMPEP_0198291868 /NCGR_PEP_ID=MMETSP1449-20131203/9236_1 /TAXON_ID=420275 /ORGANISM="Attheya septentrionalis, Strain CCMP2084" /LENGTH=327 /DNA_ID=CAMNT_0043990553 /DNA_START=114 /DNA_END=1097 /DNA_ORIENTATION=-